MENRFSNYWTKNKNPGSVKENQYNGGETIVDFSPSQSFISDAYKIVVDTDNKMMLIPSLTRSFIVTSQIGTSEPNAAHFVVPQTRRALCAQVHRYGMLSLLSNTSISHKVRVRNNDLVSHAKYREEFPGAIQKCEAACNAFHAFIAGDPSEAAEYMKDFTGGYSVLCMVYNAMSRVLIQGHNLVGSQLDDNKSTSARLLAIAAAEREEFKRFLLTDHVGHDLWHFLANEALEEIVHGMCGTSNAMLIYDTEMAGETWKAGASLKAIFKLSTAATDRWYPGELGKAALILTGSLVEVTFASIQKKVGLDSDYQIPTNISRFKELIAPDYVSRAHIQNIKAGMGYVASFCWGYMDVQKNRLDELLDAPSLLNYAAKDIAAKSEGLSLGAWARDRDMPDENAIDAIKAVLSKVSFHLRSANSTLSGIEDTTKDPDEDQDYSGEKSKIHVARLNDTGARIERPDVLLKPAEREPRFYGSGQAKRGLEEEEEAMSPMAREMKTAPMPSPRPADFDVSSRPENLKAFIARVYPGHAGRVGRKIEAAYRESNSRATAKYDDGSVAAMINDWNTEHTE